MKSWTTAVDEHLAGYCTTIKVYLEKDGSATVEDNGRGIPVGMHEKGISAERLVFTTLHAGGKFDNNAYKTSGGLHGVGSSVVNALSNRLTVRCQKRRIDSSRINTKRAFRLLDLDRRTAAGSGEDQGNRHHHQFSAGRHHF